jgi:hypothetical protein
MPEIDIRALVKDFDDTTKFRAELHSILHEPALRATRDLTTLSRALVKAGKLQDFQLIADEDAQGHVVTKTADGHYHVWKDGLQSEDAVASKAYEQGAQWASSQRTFHPSADQSLVYFFDKNKHDNLSVVLQDYLSHVLGRNPKFTELMQEVKRVAAANQIQESDFTKLPDGFRLVIPPRDVESPISSGSLRVNPPTHSDFTARNHVPKDRTERTQPSDSRSVSHTYESSSASGTVFELSRLEHRSGDHNTPDAIVHLPADFDPKKPINLVIYNHGWGSTAKSAYKDSHLEQQLAGAPPNTVLIVPEWQQSPGARSSQQGRFQDHDMFRGMLQEIFDKTPGLKGKTLNDVDKISLVAHSAGYKPSETELYSNGLFAKVTSITLLDALYDDHGFDRWIQANVKDLHSGEKRFYNFFYGTAAASREQAERTERMFAQAGLSPGRVLRDNDHGGTVLDDQSMSTYPVVFKYSHLSKDGLGAHLTMPGLYVAPVLRAANLNLSGRHDFIAQTPKLPQTNPSDTARTENERRPDGSEHVAQQHLRAAARWHMSQRGDDPNPSRWYACSATSMHMALIRNGVGGFGQNESQRLQLVSDLHLSRLDGFHGGIQGMASYARRYGLRADVHNSRGAENDLRDLDCVLTPENGGAIVNGGLARRDGSTLKHYIYVSTMVGDKYLVGDPQQENPVLWTRQQMLAFLSRNSYGFVGISSQSKPERFS